MLLKRFDNSSVGQTETSNMYCYWFTVEMYHELNFPSNFRFHFLHTKKERSVSLASQWSSEYKISIVNYSLYHRLNKYGMCMICAL